MAISIGQPGRFYDISRDEYYDSHSQYMRHMEHLRMEQMREEDRRRNMYGAQQQIAHNPYVISTGGTVAPVGTLQFVGDANDPLAFLNESDSKLLLTGETS